MDWDFERSTRLAFGGDWRLLFLQPGHWKDQRPTGQHSAATHYGCTGLDPEREGSEWQTS